ncbi:MAG: alpha/beta fold hydrolase [Raoultibacter sp.]|jgi:alpha-beta hydrolase superfamily lysophospholipase
MTQINPSELSYPSQDGRTAIHALLWIPQSGEARAIIQITHGMEEYALRYQGFASYLAHHGFIVCAQDLLGHGRSVVSAEDLSCIPAKTGKDILIEDAHALRKIMTERYPNLPYIMFGHSMGSYLMRCYVARHGAHLAAAVLCGTGNIAPAMSSAGTLLARLIAKLKGERARSSLLARMGTGAYSSRIENPRTPLDWLSIDPAVVDDYIADPLCGIPFSAASYAVLTSLTKDAASSSMAKAVPQELPVFFIAGALDPVGDNGKGVEQAAQLLRDAGLSRVDVKLYEGLRHEILNEPAKQQVYTDVVAWIEEQIG